MFIDMPDNVEHAEDEHLSKEEEDALVRESTASFADWVSNFIRRVIVEIKASGMAPFSGA